MLWYFQHVSVMSCVVVRAVTISDFHDATKTCNNNFYRKGVHLIDLWPPGF